MKKVEELTEAQLEIIAELWNIEKKASVSRIWVWVTGGAFVGLISAGVHGAIWIGILGGLIGGVVVDFQVKRKLSALLGMPVEETRRRIDTLNMERRYLRTGKREIKMEE